MLRLEAGGGLGGRATGWTSEFARAVRLLAAAKGRVIVSGVGKSGLIARKIAATLTSTGTPASYLHPVDSLHGDLGIVGPDDVAIVLSKSGESQDLFGLVGSLQRLRRADHRDHRRDGLAAGAGGYRGAGRHGRGGGLSPRPGADGEHHRGAGAGRRARGGAAGGEGVHAGRSSPSCIRAGASGRRLLLRVQDVMLPAGRVLRPDATMRDAVVSLARDRGLAMVAEDGQSAGVLTTGDLTRLAERDPDFLAVPVSRGDDPIAEDRGAGRSGGRGGRA